MATTDRVVSTQWRTREDAKKERDLDEARKAGTAPAELDEDGRDINPHIPHYMAKAPWYLGYTKPTLRHQRSTLEHKGGDIHEWYQRGERGEAARRYVAGACANCGARTHKTKDCCERPRKLGAKFTGKDIKPDEAISAVELDWDGKHDRWNGYDPNMHTDVLREFARIEEERRHFKTLEAEKAAAQKAKDDDDDDEDEDKQVDQLDLDEEQQEERDRMLTSQKDPRVRTTIRNLRIREDTAKYLLNLDTESAYYDPKTRSMRGNPFPDMDPSQAPFAGENAIRHSGQNSALVDLQVFAWDSASKGGTDEVLPQGAPTQAQALYEHYKKQKAKVQEQRKREMLDRYGGEEHMQAPAKDLLLGQTEKYVTYGRDGKPMKSQERVMISSRYEEDVHPLNHTAVWGSYWEAGHWGYSCCHQMNRNAICTARALKEGRISDGGATAIMPPPPMVPSTAPSKVAVQKAEQQRLEAMMLADGQREGKEVKRRKDKEQEEQEELVRKQRKRGPAWMEVTEEEREEYLKRRHMSDDPLQQMKNMEES